jgi:GTPase SAR1 family protein
MSEVPPPPCTTIRSTHSPLSLPLSGQDKIRPLWRHYYQNSNGLIFVIDSNDSNRLPLVRAELCTLLEAEDLRDVPILLLANKQDLEGSLTPTKIQQEILVGEIAKSHVCAVFGCCAVTGQGVEEGIAWLGESIREQRRGPSYSRRRRALLPR